MKVYVLQKGQKILDCYTNKDLLNEDIDKILNEYINKYAISIDNISLGIDKNTVTYFHDFQKSRFEIIRHSKFNLK